MVDYEYLKSLATQLISENSIKKSNTISEQSSDVNEFIPTINLSPYAQKRYSIVYGWNHNIKKLINYCQTQIEPNKIYLIVCLGVPKNLNKILDNIKDLSNNVVLVVLDKITELLYQAFLIENYSKEKLESCGFKHYFDWKKERQNNKWNEKTFIRKASPILDYYFEQMSNDKLFCSCKIFTNFLNHDIVSNNFLKFDFDEISKELFSEGIEAKQISFKALSETSIIKTAQKVISCENYKILGLDYPDNNDSIIMKINQDINNAINKTGYCNLSKVFEEMKKPPFGLSNNAFSIFYFGYAVLYGLCTKEMMSVHSQYLKGLSLKDIAKNNKLDIESVVKLEMDFHSNHRLKGYHIRFGEKDKINKKSKNFTMHYQVYGLLDNVSYLTFIATPFKFFNSVFLIKEGQHSKILNYILAQHFQIRDEETLAETLCKIRNKMESHTKIPISLFDNVMYEVLNVLQTHSEADCKKYAEKINMLEMDYWNKYLDFCKQIEREYDCSNLPQSASWLFTNEDDWIYKNVLKNKNC